MKTYGGVDVQIHVFLTSALVRSEWLASRPCRITPGENAAGTHLIGASLYSMEKLKFLKLPGLELQSLCRTARRESLYRLFYPGS
jgi:hypothetical protein